MKVSIIIRTKNEERWISSCLESVFKQNYPDFEVIFVDNNSTDATVIKALEFPVKLITIDEFKPGLAINDGIRASSGEVIVCLSGHCIPVQNDWLVNLIAPLKNEKIAGVYGRQQPMSFTPDRDKRDLLLTFGLDSKVQKKDPFFHNANSAFRKEFWEKFPFDEETPHIEDRIWGHDVLAAGYEIVYESNASVYHYHGIHQDDNPRRRRNVVNIMESLSSTEPLPVHLSAHPTAPSAADLNVIALIPVRGDPVYVGNKPLLAYTLEQAKQSKFLDQVFVLTDSEKTAAVARDLGAKAPFLRPDSLSQEFITVADVMKYGVEELTKFDVFPDLCVLLEETYPFRRADIIDKMIIELLREGANCALAVNEEARSLMVRRDNRVETVNPLIPRKLKSENFFISLFGLCFVTYPSHIRDGSMGLDNPFVHQERDPFAAMEVRNAEQLDRYKRVFSFLGLAS
jgi:rhamnosyltransferase